MKPSRMAALGISTVAFASAAFVTARPATADYRSIALYQIEPSANLGRPQGGGVWLW